MNRKEMGLKGRLFKRIILGCMLFSMMLTACDSSEVSQIESYTGVSEIYENITEESAETTEIESVEEIFETVIETLEESLVQETTQEAETTVTETEEVVETTQIIEPIISVESLPVVEIPQVEKATIDSEPQVVDAPEADSNTGILVWKSATGKKYHSINDCGNMNPNKATQITRSEAQALGLGQCSKCW